MRNALLEINTKFKNRVFNHRFKNRVFNASTPPLQGVAKGLLSLSRILFLLKWDVAFCKLSVR